MSLAQAKGVDRVSSEEGSDGVAGGYTLISPLKFVVVRTVRNEDDEAYTALIHSGIQEL
jgi:hypothetical protein